MLRWCAQLSVSTDNHQFVRERPSGRVLTMPSAATPEGGERQIFADFMKFQLPHPHDVAGRTQRPQLGHKCSYLRVVPTRVASRGAQNRSETCFLIDPDKDTMPH